MADNAHEMVDDAAEILADTVESFKNLLVVVSDTDRSVVKRLGAKYNKRAKAWQIPEGHKDPSVFKDYLQDKQIGFPGREYITCAKEQKEEAKALGAKWDPIANSWYSPEGNEQGEALKAAFAVATPEELETARAARRDYIDVDRADKDQAKAFGAKYDPGLGSWCIPVGCETAEDLKATYALQSDERLYELQAERMTARLEARQGKETEKGQGFDPDRQYIRVPREDKDAAKGLGARWDGKAVSWYIPEDAKHGELLVKGWPLQTKEQLEELQAEKAKATAQSSDKSADKSAEKSAEKVTDKSADKSGDKSAAYEAAGKRAFGIWKNTADWATPKTSSYLEDKGVRGHGIKVDSEGKTLIPLRDVEGGIRSMQIIDEAGNERFLRGGQISGNMHKIGKAELFKDGMSLVVAPDYASGASIHEATKLPVAVAFHEQNIQKVAEAVQGKYADVKLVVAAENGQELASKAAQAVGARLMLPNLSKAEREQGLSSWNDVHKHRGSEQSLTAMRQVLKANAAEKSKAQQRPKAKGADMEAGLGI